MELKLTKELLLDSWVFFKANFLPLCLIILPFAIPIEIFTTLFEYYISPESFHPVSITPSLIGFLFYPIYAAATVFYIASTAYGEALSCKDAWGFGIRTWRSYLILAAILIAAIGFGFILIIPGVILAARLSFSEFELLLNNKSPLESIKSSWNFSRDYFWLLLRGGIIITIIIYAPYLLLASLFDSSTIVFWALDLTSNIAYAALSTIYTIYAFRVYDFAKNEHNKLRHADPIRSV